MKNIKILFVIIGIALLASCEGFLDVKPSQSAESSTSITNANDAKVIMNGVMRQMASYRYYGRNFILYGDAKGGDFAIRSQGRGYDGLYTFNHSQTTGNYGDFWAHMYNLILQVNTLIQNIDVMEANGQGSTALSEYKGQAYTTRALIYFDLVRLYGKPYNMDKNSLGVPLILEPLDAMEQRTRNTVDAVYQQIIADLKAGESLLSKSKRNGQLNYYGNLAIQGRVYLHMDNFSEALRVAELIIGSKVYSLYLTPSAWTNSWQNEFGTESIFELGVYENEADNGTGSLGYYLLKQYKVTGASGWFMASDYYLNRLSQDPDDVRWTTMDEDETSVAGAKRFGSSVKYVGGYGLTGDKGKASATNIKVIRLSEIYLMAAEAALATDKDKAATYLNEIRKRAPNLAPATAATVSIDMIMDEKSKEFFTEGHRYWDMLRLNKEIEFNDDFIQPYVEIQHREKKIDRTFYKTILPIPQDEMDANPALHDQQNTGY